MCCSISLQLKKIRIPENVFLILIAFQYLKKKLIEWKTKLPPLKNFILPGGNILVSYCHIARCVCRRAERAVLRLNETEESPEIVTKFLNRLSDYLFVLSRKISLELDIEEIKWSV